LFITNDDHIIVRDAMDSKQRKFWKKAMVEEMESLDKNEGWDLVEPLARKKPHW